MKSFVSSILTVLLLFAGSVFASAQSRYTDELQNMNIRLLDPVDMVSPSKNEDAMIAYSIGSYYMYENRTNEAEKYLLEAIALDPGFVDAYDHLGIVYRRQSRYAESEAMYLRSIELNDQNKVPFTNLAIVYRIQNKLQEAFELYMHVIEILPYDPEGYYGVGELFFMVSDYETALHFFDIAIMMYDILESPYIYDAYYYKGLILYYTGDYSEALKFLEEARIGNPNNSDLERVIRDIRSNRLN